MIKLDSSKKIWITSDTHYGHKNICRGVTEWRMPDGSVPESQTRPYDTIDKMNAAIVDNINNVVGQDDTLIHLGDWSFGGFENIEEFYNRLICKNIHLILGNHDRIMENEPEWVKGYLTGYKTIDYLQDEQVTLYFDGPNGDHPEDNVRDYP